MRVQQTMKDFLKKKSNSVRRTVFFFKHKGVNLETGGDCTSQIEECELERGTVS
mgnify:CR=1 FL=1